MIWFLLFAVCSFLFILSFVIWVITRVTIEFLIVLKELFK